MKFSALLLALSQFDGAAGVEYRRLRPRVSLATRAVDADRAAANASLGQAARASVVDAWLRGEGPSLGDAMAQGEAALTDDAAIRSLGDKLPGVVAAMARRAADRGAGNATTEALRKAAGMQDFDEDSLQKARGILNGMIEGAWKRMDDEIIRCKSYEDRSRAVDQQLRADISRLGSALANYERMRTEANQGIDTKSNEVLAMKSMYNTAANEYKLSTELDQAELLVRRNDLAVVQFIMELTRCPENDRRAGALLTQLDAPQVCTAEDGSHDFAWTNHTLQAKYERLMTSTSRRMFRRTLARLFGNGTEHGRLSHLQLDDLDEDEANPVPAIDLPGTTAPPPIEDVKQVTQKPAKGQWKKCVDTAPDCALLHDTMSMMWGKFKDKVDQLQLTMTQRDGDFDEMSAQVNNQIRIVVAAKSVFNEMLAETISVMNGASEEKLEKEKDLHQNAKEMQRTMKKCRNTIDEILFNDICATRKVRNGVLKFSTVSPPEKIRDCDMTEFVAAECSVSCDNKCPDPDPTKCGGSQVLAREIGMAPNDLGVKCPTLTMVRRCNQIKCSEDCQMGTWSAWGECSKECGGGVQGRTRPIRWQPLNGGKACDTVQEQRPCNTGSCDRDCRLGKWTSWSSCSMACGGGLQTRARHVLVPIRAMGRCPKENSPQRLESRGCNKQPCAGDEFCVAKLDVILALDSSGSLGETGAKALSRFAEILADRFASKYLGTSAMRVGVLQFGNGVIQSNGQVSSAIPILPLTDDMSKVKQAIHAMTWAKGFTNMAQAFVLADKMLMTGRGEAQSAVLTITDSMPSFVVQTRQKVNELKKSNIAMYFISISETQGVYHRIIKEFASQPWETHMVRIPGLESVEADPDVWAQRSIAVLCPLSVSPSTQARTEAGQGFFMVRRGGRCGHPGEIIATGVTGPAECKALAEANGAWMFSYSDQSPSGLPSGKCRAEKFKQELEPMRRLEGEMYCIPWTAENPFPAAANHQECAEACHKTSWCAASSWFPTWQDRCYHFKFCATQGESNYGGITYLNPTVLEQKEAINNWIVDRVDPRCPESPDGNWTKDLYFDYYALNSAVEA